MSDKEIIYCPKCLWSLPPNHASVPWCHECRHRQLRTWDISDGTHPTTHFPNGDLRDTGQSFNLVCHTCHLALWVGQKPSGAKLPLWRSDEDVDKALSILMAYHQGHRLGILEGQHTSVDYEDMLPESYYE